MTIPESVGIDPDDLHRELYESMSDEAQEAVNEFVENGLSERVTGLVEEAIYKRRQADRD